MNRLVKFLIIGLFILNSCKKDNNQEIKLEVVYLSDFGMCFPTFNSAFCSGYVICDNKSYQDFRNSTVFKDITCDTAQLPNIDFDKYSLIGIFTEGQCSLNNTKEIITDTSHKDYVYRIKVNESGSCKMLVTTMNWAKVPKLPSDYNVVFNITTNK